jgi:hypothetical protein
MTKDLAGKIAFVTGSGRGLGNTMTKRLAEHGAHVAVHDLIRKQFHALPEPPCTILTIGAFLLHGEEHTCVWAQQKWQNCHWSERG